MSQVAKQRIAKTFFGVVASATIITLVLLTYADARRVLAERAAAEASVPQSEKRPPIDRAALLARALRSARIDGATIIHVDDDANTNGDGTSWATAFNDLQDALDAARHLAGAPAEIWVAAGTYKPDRGTGDREMSFELVNSTGLYGGFAGSETDFNDRDFRASETILSGDLIGNDVGANGREENSYLIVRAPNYSANAVLDGLTITAGETGASLETQSLCVLSNCRIVDNIGVAGCGVVVGSDAAPVVANCIISGNGLSSPVGQSVGGGIRCESTAAVFYNCLVAGNVASTGGACALVQSCGRACGPMDASTWINCTIAQNIATDTVGGVLIDGVTFVHPPFPSFVNTIIWGNADSTTEGEAAQISTVPGDFAWINYSCIQGWTGLLGGTGNTGTDPAFIDSSSGNYRLALPSSSIDAGNNDALPGDVAEDQSGGPRFADHPLVQDIGVSTSGWPVVDLGAYEWFDPDCNGNGVVDSDDIAAGTSLDINSNGIPDECELDCNSNGWPDDYDIAQAVVPDCNSNGVPDGCDLHSGTHADCNANQIPDDCDGDCNGNGLFDGCDIAAGTSEDCDGDGIPDNCTIASFPEADCDASGNLDECEIASGSSEDCNTNGMPDACDTWNGPPSPGNTAPVPLNRTAWTDRGSDRSPQLATDGTGNWIAVWPSYTDLDETIGTDDDILFAKSVDNGLTWTWPKALNATAFADSATDNQPCIATDARGTWIVVWVSDNDLGGTIGDDPDILFARSTDNGDTWTYPAVLNANAPTSTRGNALSDIAVDQQGVWVVAWHSTEDLDGAIGTDPDTLFARSIEGGLAWTYPQPLNINAGVDSGSDEYPRIATDSRGTWIAVWRSTDSLDGTIGTDSDILFARSDDFAFSWTAPMPLDPIQTPTAGGDYYPDIQTDQMGLWVVAWESWRQLPGAYHFDSNVHCARSFDDGITWTPPRLINDRLDTMWDNTVTVASDGAGHLVAVWAAGPSHSEASDNEILYSQSADGGATWAPPVSLRGPNSVQSIANLTPTIATDRRGHWIAAWSSNDDPDGTLWLDQDIMVLRFRMGLEADCNGNRIPDDCEDDCNENEIVDECDLAKGTSDDCNTNGVPDECDLSDGTSNDCNGNAVPDECDVSRSFPDTTGQDICALAEPICPGVQYVGTTAGNTSDGSASCASSYGTEDAWYSYTPAAAGSASIELCNGSEYDTALSVHTGCPGTRDNELVCDDDGCGDAGGSSKVQLDVAEGVTYYVRVSGWNGREGAYTLEIGGPECSASSEDCNHNGVPDECDLAAGSGADCNTNGVPDTCDLDFDGDGYPDECDDDADGDGVMDTVDACLFSPVGIAVNPFGGPMGDLDNDCDVDLDDYFFFEVCLYISGPNGGPGFQDCQDVFDFDGDNDVDLEDFGAFQDALAGP